MLRSETVSCTCYGGYNPGCDEHGVRVTDNRRPLSAVPAPLVPGWISEWHSPAGHCVCDNPDCPLGADKWVRFLVRERDDHQVFWQILRVDQTGGVIHAQERGFQSKVLPFVGTFERAKAEIEECMEDGLSFTAMPDWKPLIFPIAKVEVKIQ